MDSSTVAANDVQMDPGWKEQLADQFATPYFRQIKTFLIAEKKAGKTIYPTGSQIFSAFDATPFDAVKVVVLGQDPYHGPGQAHGLCFSVNPGVKPPPSLVNIYKELIKDIGIPVPSSGNLLPWARQGVFCLNAILTVEARKPASHRNIGWEQFTDQVISTLAQKRQHIVFMLWGNFARSKASLIDENKHLILKAAHPSPFSAHNGFFGCRHFSKANAYLKQHGIPPIDWSLS